MADLAKQESDLVSHALSRLTTFAALALVLLALTPALTFGIRERLSTHTMENVALVTSQETWLRLHAGDSRAWLVSTNDGPPRLEKPPMLTWLNLLAWADLDPDSATPIDLTFRARLVSAALGLLMVASIFWLGNTLGGLRMALLAALAAGSTFFLQRQARTASYDIYFTAWMTLSIAAGVWAIDPGGAVGTRGRRVTGWSICALAMCASVMSKNPLAFALIVPPLLLAIFVAPRERQMSSSIALIIATAIASLPVAWWYWYVFTYFETARRALGREFTQPRAGDVQPVYYYLGLFGLIVPWTIWLIAALVEAVKALKAASPWRTAARFALLWFAFTFILFSCFNAKQQRYILSIMPATGLLLALLFVRHDEAARQGEHDRGFEILGRVHWALLLVASVLIWPFLVLQDELIARGGGRLMQRIIEPPHWLPATIASIALVAICMFGWRWHARWPWKSALATAAWMIMFMTTFWRQEAGVPSERVQTYYDEANRIARLVGNETLYSLRFRRADRAWKINEEFRFYFGRIIPRIAPDDVNTMSNARAHEGAGDEEGEESRPRYIIIRPSEDSDQFLQNRGFELIDHAQVDKDDRQQLWRLTFQ